MSELGAMNLEESIKYTTDFIHSILPEWDEVNIVHWEFPPVGFRVAEVALQKDNYGSVFFQNDPLCSEVIFAVERLVIYLMYGLEVDDPDNIEYYIQDHKDNLEEALTKDLTEH